MRITFAILFTSIFFNLGNKVNAQNTSFKKIEYAYFDINSPRIKQKNTVSIYYYITIDKGGLVSIYHHDNYNNKFSYYAYQLSINQLKKIADIFKEKNRLEDYMSTKELKSSGFFAGYYSFLLVTYNNSKDSLCFITSFMSNNFQEVLHILDGIYTDKKIKKRQPFIISSDFNKSLLLSYKKSKYLPKIQFPPAFRSEDQH